MEFSKKKLEKKFEMDNKISLSDWSDSHLIYKIINENEYKLGVEIGVAYGSHSDNILDMTSIDKLYGIDPYLEYGDYEKDPMCMSQKTMDDMYIFVNDRLTYYGDRFQLLRETSIDASSNFDNETLDFVYIDGNHFEDYIKLDLYTWWEKIRIGGIISGHDYNHGNFPFVTKLVDQFCIEKNIELKYMGNHVWYAKK
jgi:hypothetical protein